MTGRLIYIYLIYIYIYYKVRECNHSFTYIRYILNLTSDENI